jgi:radical SAM protein with 4Fe4S-binding SPASM domain
MSLELFEKINNDVKQYTNELAYHIVGDPLVLTNLDKYLDISLNHNLKVNITTAASNFSANQYETLIHKSIRQINFSINSFNANDFKKDIDEYLNPIFEFCRYVLDNKREFFINLRIWNLDESKSAKEFNDIVFKKANIYFDSQVDCDEIYKQKPKNIRVAKKIFFNFDEYFSWPSLQNDFVSDVGFCYGLDSHFGILANGDVIPCCLDKDAVINLGNINDNSINEILNSNRAIEMIDGFKQKSIKEELCKKCSYRKRFDLV